MSAGKWVEDFSRGIQRKAEQIANLEVEKGDLETSLVMIGSRVASLFPDDIKQDDLVPDVVIRLLEELAARRKP